MRRSYALGGRESSGCSTGRRCGFPHLSSRKTARGFGGSPGVHRPAHALHSQHNSNERHGANRRAGRSFLFSLCALWLKEQRRPKQGFLPKNNQPRRYAMSVTSFIATTGSGLTRATHTASGAWHVETLLADQDVRCLAADPLHPDVVYAGTQGQGVFRSDDGGTTWRPAGLGGHIVKALAVSQAEPGVVYAGTKPPLLFVSRDGGLSWNELDPFRRVPGRWWWRSPAERPFTAYVQGIALSPTDPNVIVVGIEAGAGCRATMAGRVGAGTGAARCATATRSCSTARTGIGSTRAVALVQAPP